MSIAGRDFRKRHRHSFLKDKGVIREEEEGVDKLVRNREKRGVISKN